MNHMPMARTIVLAIIAIVTACSSGTPLPSVPTDAAQPDLSSATTDLANPLMDSATPDSAVAPDLATKHDLAAIPDLANADLAGACGPTGGCPSGPLCGGTCCIAGESCDPTTNTCRCGTSPACQTGDMCSRGGAIMPGQTCGVLCCGKSGPCPG